MSWTARLELEPAAGQEQQEEAAGPEPLAFMRA
jgi:hypothetical protein